MARVMGLPMPRLRWIFSISTVASSTRMPTASARPPSVMIFNVCPSAPRRIIEEKIARGIETAAISVLRQLPRKSRIIRAVRQAAIRPSFSTPSIAARTNSDWSKSSLIFSAGGSVASMRGSASRTRLMMSSVEALADFSTVSNAARAVLRNDIRLHGEAVTHLGDVTHGDGGVADLLDRQVVERFQHPRAAVEPHKVLAVPDLLRSGWQNEVLRCQRGGDVRRRESLCVEF